MGSMPSCSFAPWHSCSVCTANETHSWISSCPVSCGHPRHNLSARSAPASARSGARRQPRRHSLSGAHAAASEPVDERANEQRDELIALRRDKAGLRTARCVHDPHLRRMRWSALPAPAEGARPRRLTARARPRDQPHLRPDRPAHICARTAAPTSAPGLLRRARGLRRIHECGQIRSRPHPPPRTAAAAAVAEPAGSRWSHSLRQAAGVPARCGACRAAT